MAPGISETILHILTVLYLFSLGGLFFYGTNCYVMLYLFRRYRNRGEEEYREAVRAFDRSPWRSDPPLVTVQLPLYNERFVVGRLLKAVCSLDYPRERLEIQVLDDSTDDSAQIAGRLVAEYRKQGFSSFHIRRDHRRGFKAGALREGMEKARGELIAIFDADFVPPADFLRRTIPYFCDPDVGMVQARWGHLNPEASVLTRAQSVGIDGHFSVEQGARAWSGLFLNFNGTAGIWRRQAIVDAGGWQEDTLTEDMDLSYRAQLAGWQLKYVLDLVCPAELPDRVAAFKSQQFRWAKGSIQTARKLIPALLKAPHSWFAKYQAILHMTHYLIHPFMLATILLSYPLISRLNIDRHPVILATLVILFALSTFGPSTLYVASQRALYPDTWRSRVKWMPLLTVVGTGIALSNSRAVLEGLLFSGGGFVRTPKSGFQRNSAAARRRESYRLETGWLPWIELLLGIYAFLALTSALTGNGIWVSPFLFFYTCGFLYISLKGLNESLGAHFRYGLTKISTVLLFLLFWLTPAIVFAQRPADSPWPTYRGDLKRSGRSNFKGPATSNNRWVFSTGLSEKEGGIETDPVIGPDGTIYIGANNGIFYALDPETGSVRWAFPTAFDTFAIYSTPFVDRQGIVYFGAKDGKVYALRAPKRGILGELVWSLSLGTTIQTSPAFTPDGTLVIGADDWAYYGISPPIGGSGPRIKWRFQTQGTLISSPAVDTDGTIFVASMDGKVYALEPPKEATQAVKVRWTFSSGARDDKGGFENAPVLDDTGTLYIGGNDGILYALDTKTGKVRWTFDGVARSGYRTFAIFSSVAIGPDRTIYFGGKDGVLYALKEREGFFRPSPEVLWRHKLEAGIQSSPLITADGTVYIGDERGNFYAIQPPRPGGSAKTLWKFATKGTVISSPALAPDGTLYVGSMDGKLYAFRSGDKPAAGSQGSFSGTWYGTFESEAVAGKVRAVLAQKGAQVLAAWFHESVGRGEGEGTAEGNRLSVSMPIRTARCKGAVKAEARLESNEIRADIQIDQCAGKIVAGKLTLRKS